MSEQSVDTNKHSVILFDGVCNFCNGSVQLIIKRDRASHFRFASLQSNIAASLLAEHLRPIDLDSIVLIERGQVFTASTAVLRISKKLDGLWKIAYALIIVPKPIRDAMYRWFAKRRFQFFGRRESCMIPTADIRNRFLEVDERKGDN